MTLDARRHRDRKRSRVTRVWLDGVDVTDRCFYADGRRGVVRFYCVDAYGRKYLDPSRLRAATEERRGHVRWGTVSA